MLWSNECKVQGEMSSHILNLVRATHIHIRSIESNGCVYVFAGVWMDIYGCKCMNVWVHVHM